MYPERINSERVQLRTNITLIKMASYVTREQNRDRKMDWHQNRGKVCNVTQQQSFVVQSCTVIVQL